jgi:hypothetical protein
MTYASGGLIQASDYNNLINGTNQLNTVWSTGSGAAGYGQTAIPVVTAGTDTVTAVQWASLINNLNSILTHQAGAGSGISAPTAGNTITYLSTLQAAVNTAYTNRANYASSGATVSLGTKTGSVNIAATAAATPSVISTVTFASANQARLFFNCGGRIQFVCSAVDSSGTARSIAAKNDFSALNVTVNNATNNITAVGYRGLTTVSSLVSTTASAAPYATTSASQSIYSASVADTTNGANGASVMHNATLTIPADNSFGGTVVLSLTVTAYAIYPETTNLTNVWGTPVLT